MVASRQLGDLLVWIKDLQESSIDADTRSAALQQRMEAKYDAMAKDVVDRTADAPVGQRACRVPIADDPAESKSSSKSSRASAKADDKEENAGYTCIPECLPFKIDSPSSASAATTAAGRTYALKEVIIHFRMEAD